jgi:hypothetical protein
MQLFEEFLKKSRASGLRSRFVRGWFGLAWVYVLVLVAAPVVQAGGGGHARVDAGSAVAGHGVGPGSVVAIADFDGDLRPDSATVQPGRNATGRENYSIQLKFSAMGAQSMQLDAPSGGLRIEARDVNGDHAVDLILTTAWLREPVAILLNDGHGNFSRSEPSAFPDAFSGGSTNWSSNADASIDVAGLPPQTPALAIGSLAAARFENPSAHKILAAAPGFRAGPFLVSTAGRAPPSALSL